MQQLEEKRRDLERIAGTGVGTVIAALVFMALAYTILEATLL
jgi:hypothetical protein